MHKFVPGSCRVHLCTGLPRYLRWGSAGSHSCQYCYVTAGFDPFGSSSETGLSLATYLLMRLFKCMLVPDAVA